jgi:hypothetical protein
MVPDHAAYAGAYWWLVWSNDRNTFVSYYSTPASFTLRPLVTLLPLRTRLYPSLHWLDVKVRWRANVRALTVKVRLLHRGKVIWKRTENDDNLAGSTGSTSFTWHRPRRIRQRTRLTLRVSVVAKGVTKTRALVVRSP